MVTEWLVHLRDTLYMVREWVVYLRDTLYSVHGGGVGGVPEGYVVHG